MKRILPVGEGAAMVAGRGITARLLSSSDRFVVLIILSFFFFFLSSNVNAFFLVKRVITRFFLCETNLLLPVCFCFFHFLPFVIETF